MSEGTYLYRAEIDDEMRLDPALLYKIVYCSHGVASKIQVNSIEQKVTLRNRSKQKIGFKLQSLTEWMRIKPETLVLPARKKREITAIFQPEHLLPGINLGWIRLESERKPVKSFLAPIYVIGMTNGAVPILRNEELIFPQIEQGKVDGVPLMLDIIGEGELKGEVQPSTILRFIERDLHLHVQNETAFKPMTTAPLVRVLSERLSNAYRKQIHLCYKNPRASAPIRDSDDTPHTLSWRNPAPSDSLHYRRSRTVQKPPLPRREKITKTKFPTPEKN